MLISEWGGKQMHFFVFKGKKTKQILLCDYEKQTNKQKKNTLLIHGIMYKKIVELKKK